ncbi:MULTISPECIES: hypothetical protein [unclassified Ruegeria]|uniref:hypothetical protein n=1 Tax=unclassified Ruegeria TaxID=2625375 RepID=UPI001487EA53|nr:MULTISPECIES: hypothetical protein [unclassified Ruegeria]
MLKKSDAKNLFFLSQTSKRIRLLERKMTPVLKQLDLMIKMSGLPVLDASTLSREATAALKTMVDVDKELRSILALASKNIKMLSRAERKTAADNFRGQVRTFEKRYMDAAFKKAQTLGKISKSKETHVSSSPNSPFVVILRIIQIIILMNKYYRSETKKL